MKGTFESLMVGASLLASGLAHRRAGEVGRQVELLAETVRAPNPVPAPAASAARSGMPLPTGYGLQVRGPAGEALVVPVCLPPGFELDSMMLCPEFLARESHGAAAPAAAPVPAPAPAVEPQPERIAGTMQYVFGAGPAYQTQVEHHETPAPVAAPQPERIAVPERERVPAPFARAGIETHQLS
jgi:hypothetical protein